MIIDINWMLLNLVGGIPTPLKNMSSSLGMIIPNNYMESQNKCSKASTTNVCWCWQTYDMLILLLSSFQLHQPRNDNIQRRAILKSKDSRAYLIEPENTVNPTKTRSANMQPQETRNTTQTISNPTSSHLGSLCAHLSRQLPPCCSRWEEPPAPGPCLSKGCAKMPQIYHGDSWYHENTCKLSQFISANIQIVAEISTCVQILDGLRNWTWPNPAPLVGSDLSTHRISVGLGNRRSWWMSKRLQSSSDMPKELTELLCDLIYGDHARGGGPGIWAQTQGPHTSSIIARPISKKSNFINMPMVSMENCCEARNE